MKRKLAAISLLAVSAVAHEPITTKLTWTQEISRIVYKRCLACHRTGAAVALQNYDEARPWAKAIRDEVLERRMPPWGAVKGFGEFAGDPSLTQPEIEMIVNWVEGGAPKGDDVYLPSLPTPPIPERSVRGATIAVRGERTLTATLDAAAIRPDGLPDGGWMQVRAALPGGAVRNLLWVRDYRAAWKRAFRFRDIERLPKGARIIVHSSAPRAVAILTSAAKPGS
ncbi:MAG: hypothetical protein ACRD96_04390 [Bryobacteraceae bacterium]